MQNSFKSSWIAIVASGVSRNLRKMATMSRCGGDDSRRF